MNNNAAPADPPRPFKRSMTTADTLLLTLSVVTPASSLFVIIPGVIQQAGTGALWALLAAALVALCMAFVYAELASAFPLAGGEYAMIGRALGPLFGFSLMGANVVGSTLGPAVLALGASAYVSALWPGVHAVPFALAIMVGSTLVGLFNIRLNAWVTGVFLIVECLALMVLAALGFSHVHRGLGDLLLHPAVLDGGALKPASAATIGLATAVGVFAYNGFGCAVYFAEEMQGASRGVARAILWALALTLAFEIVPTLAVLMGAPNLRGLLSSESPFTDFVLQTGGRTMSTVMGLGVALSIINSAIATLLINARFLFSSGRDRIWHGALNAALTRLHPRFDSPWMASLIAGATAMAACFIPFHLLLVLNGAGIVILYGLLCVAVITARRRGRSAHAAYHMPLFPAAPVLALAALLYVVYANWIDLDVGRPSLLINSAMLAASALYFLALRRLRGPALAMHDPVAGSHDA